MGLGGMRGVGLNAFLSGAEQAMVQLKVAALAGHDPAQAPIATDDNLRAPALDFGLAGTLTPERQHAFALNGALRVRIRSRIDGSGALARLFRRTATARTYVKKGTAVMIDNHGRTKEIHGI